MGQNPTKNADRTERPEELATSFGFEGVNVGEKQPKVNEVFHSVAKRYDVMNDFMSMGMHRVWKEAMVASLAPAKTGKGWKTVDVAGGTGDIAFRIVEASNRTAHTTVFDINASMLEVGKERAEKAGLTPYLDFVEGTAEELPFADNSFDAYTIAFGIRNVPRIDFALSEAFRVLRPGGRFMCLEFSEVDMPVLEQVYEQWSFKAIPAIGKAITGDRESYQYLVESIRKFPNQNTFAKMIETAGFERVNFKNYSGGIVALHSGWKI